MKRIALSFGLLCAVALTGCGGPDATSVESGIISDAETAVKAHLKDPNSAQFSDVEVHHPRQNVTVVCGNVNAKNSFGGMTGPQKFVSSGALTGIESEFPDGQFVSQMATVCVG